MEFLEGHLPGTFPQRQSQLYQLPFELREKIANDLYRTTRREEQRKEPMASTENEVIGLQMTEQGLEDNAFDNMENLTNYWVVLDERQNLEEELEEMRNIIRRRIQENAFLLRLRNEQRFIPQK